MALLRPPAFRGGLRRGPRISAVGILLRDQLLAGRGEEGLPLLHAPCQYARDAGRLAAAFLHDPQPCAGLFRGRGHLLLQSLLHLRERAGEAAGRSGLAGRLPLQDAARQPVGLRTGRRRRHRLPDPPLRAELPRALLFRLFGHRAQPQPLCRRRHRRSGESLPGDADAVAARQPDDLRGAQLPLQQGGLRDLETAAQTVEEPRSVQIRIVNRDSYGNHPSAENRQTDSEGRGRNLPEGGCGRRPRVARHGYGRARVARLRIRQNLCQRLPLRAQRRDDEDPRTAELVHPPGFGSAHPQPVEERPHWLFLLFPSELNLHNDWDDHRISFCFYKYIIS